jgi:hypothetical protein
MGIRRHHAGRFMAISCQGVGEAPALGLFYSLGNSLDTMNTKLAGTQEVQFVTTKKQRNGTANGAQGWD